MCVIDERDGLTVSTTALIGQTNVCDDVEHQFDNTKSHREACLPIVNMYMPRTVSGWPPLVGWSVGGTRVEAGPEFELQTAGNDVLSGEGDGGERGARRQGDADGGKHKSSCQKVSKNRRSE